MSYNSKYKGSEVEELLDSIGNKVDKDTLAAVATSGSYNDLTNKPSIPDSLSDLATDATHRTVTDTEKATWNAKSNFSGSYNDLSNKPTIPSAVTEDTVSGWGFTKNTGTYSKPSTGIPKTDLATAVQTSLGKADTALQSHQDISGKLDKTTAESTYLSKTDASNTYLGKTAKAASATSADSATKATQDASGNVITSTYATKTELNNKQDKNLYFSNVEAFDWVGSTEYSDYPYQCDLLCDGVRPEYYPEVVFGASEAASGNYAALCESLTDAVRIYSKVNTSIIIPTIQISK